MHADADAYFDSMSEHAGEADPQERLALGGSDTDALIAPGGPERPTISALPVSQRSLPSPWHAAHCSAHGAAGNADVFLSPKVWRQVYWAVAFQRMQTLRDIATCSRAVFNQGACNEAMRWLRHAKMTGDAGRAGMAKMLTGQCGGDAWRARVMRFVQATLSESWDQPEIISLSRWLDACALFDGADAPLGHDRSVLEAAIWRARNP